MKKYLSVGTRLLMSTGWGRPIERYHDNDYIQIGKKNGEEKWTKETRQRASGRNALLSSIPRNGHVCACVLL